jgi:hypothetical protein
MAFTLRASLRLFKSASCGFSLLNYFIEPKKSRPDVLACGYSARFSLNRAR